MDIFEAEKQYTDYFEYYASMPINDVFDYN